MKLKDFICLGTCIFVFGCGQAHPTTSRPGETQAAGQAVPNSNEGNDVNPETDNEQSSDADTTDTNDNQDTDTQPTDPSIPAEDEDQNEDDPSQSETTDISETGDVTETSEPDESDDSEDSHSDDTFQTPSPGTYSYERIPLGGFKSAVRAQFHPSGDYALILSQYDTIHIYDWETQNSLAVSVGSNNKMLLTDLEFSSDGSCAWITATHTDNGTKAMVLRFDDAIYRSLTEQSDPTDTIASFTTELAGQSAKAIALPWDNSFPLVVYQSGQSGNYIWTLRNFHPETGSFEDLYTATNASAPAEDMAIVNNEFGDWGALIVGGASNADTRYYTELSGQGEWRSQLGNTGNANRVAAYPGGEYALMISWSGRSIYRFKQGEFSSYSEALRFSTMGIWDVSFQDDGRRALATGRVSANGAAGTMLEYRHDLFTCSAGTQSCGQDAVTDVSVWGFDDAPWQADSNTYIFDTAFRPGCDGGILVGGYNTQSGNGFMGEFQIENGQDCRTTP